MVSAISRLSSEIQASVSDATESIYADTLSAKMQSLQSDINKVKMTSIGLYFSRKLASRSVKVHF